MSTARAINSRLRFDESEIEALATFRDALRAEKRAQRNLDETSKVHHIGSSKRLEAAKAANKARDALVRANKELAEVLLAGDV